MIKKKFIFDLDNTLCKTKNSDYKNSKPIKRSINLVNSLKKEGHQIIIYTARYMGRFNSNQEIIKKKYYNKTKKY